MSTKSGEVQSGCAVTLLNLADQRRIQKVILDSSEVTRQGLEIADTGELAISLLGRSVGDTVKLRQLDDSSIEVLEYRIEDIQSKYVHAFQETADQFSTMFPDNKGLQKVRIQNNDLSGILVPIDQRHKLVTFVNHAYQSGSLSLGECSKLTGSSVVEIWASLVSMKGGRVQAGSGLSQQHDLPWDKIIKTDPIVLDLTATLTIVHLQLENVLLAAFDRIIIPRVVVDEVGRLISELPLKSKSTMTIHKGDDDKYIRQEHSEDSHESLFQKVWKLTKK